MKDIRNGLWLIAAGLLLLVAASYTFACASGPPPDPTPQASRCGCVIGFSTKETGERVKTYERVVVVGIYDDDRWKVVFPDRQHDRFGWLPYPKARVNFVMCPTGFSQGLDMAAFAAAPRLPGMDDK